MFHVVSIKEDSPSVSFSGIISGSFAQHLTEGFIVHQVAAAVDPPFVGGSTRKCGDMTALLGSVAK